MRSNDCHKHTVTVLLFTFLIKKNRPIHPDSNSLAFVALYNPWEIDCTGGGCDSAVRFYDDDGDSTNDAEIGPTFRAMFTGGLFASAGKRWIKLEPGTKATGADDSEQASYICMCDPYPHPEPGKTLLIRLGITCENECC